MKIVAGILIVLVSCNVANGANILFDKLVSASSTYNSSSLASNIVDCDTNTVWNAGSFPKADVVINTSNNSVIYSIVLIPEQSPAGKTTHNILVSDHNNIWNKVERIEAYTESGKPIIKIFNPPLKDVKKIQIQTIDSPSWVAWREIQAYSSQEEMSLGCSGQIEAKEKDKLAYNRASYGNTITYYQEYLKQYPNGAYVSNAKQNIYELSPAGIAQKKQEEKEQRLAEAKRAKQEAEARKVERIPYEQAKNIGDKVCWTGRTTGFLLGRTTESATGFVENKSGNKIQIRIARDSYGASLNGVRLDKNTIIWDDYTNWKKCY
jgi:hypothetical protein